MTKFKKSKFKAGRFYGSFYQRGGYTKDKYGNVSFEKPTFRNNHSGIVVNNHGRYIGAEKIKMHNYGRDPRRIAITKPQTRQQKAIMIKLRQKGRV